MKTTKKKTLLRLAPMGMLAAALLCVLALLLFGGESGDAAQVSEPLPPASAVLVPAGLRIAAASDTHLDPDNTEKTETLTETAYNMEIADAMLWDARNQGAELLLITGDLCNSGRQNKHEALAAKLRAAEEAGLSVYALPGNHDLGPVTQTAFAALYADFGYDEAYSRDEGSLSYCVMRDDVMLLMMDTAGYPAGAIVLPGAPARQDNQGFFTEETLRWAETMLQTAHERKIPVLAAGHYNLLPEISRQAGSGYYVENGERFADLLRAYGVPLYLSGHMHLRAVYQEDGLTEQLTEYLLAYPTGYTLLDLTAESLTVRPRRVDVDAWAAAAGQEDPVLLHFADWLQQSFASGARRTVAAMAERNPISEAEQEAAADFFIAVMDAYWRGTLASERDRINTIAGRDAFLRCAEGYSYGWWIPELIETAPPLLGGYTLEYGHYGKNG